MKKTIISATVILALAIFMSACEKGDTEKPVITINAPETEEVLYIGQDVHFEVEFSDNVELNSYKVDIHSNFDGHSHKNLSEDGVAWSFQQSWEFDEGQKNAHVHHHEIVIPDDIDGEEIATGDYHFMVYCTDAEGNESWVAVPVEIQNSTDTQAPVFSNMQAPDANTVFTNDETITITGTVEDDVELGGIFVAIMPEGSTDEQINETECTAVLLHTHEGLTDQTSYDFSASVIVGQTEDNNPTPNQVDWQSGNYFLVVKAKDKSGNAAISYKFPIELNIQ